MKFEKILVLKLTNYYTQLYQINIYQMFTYKKSNK